MNLQDINPLDLISLLEQEIDRPTFEGSEALFLHSTLPKTCGEAQRLDMRMAFQCGTRACLSLLAECKSEKEVDELLHAIDIATLPGLRRLTSFAEAHGEKEE